MTPFESKPVTGIPVHTLVRGRFVQRDRGLVRDARGYSGLRSKMNAAPL